MRMLEDFRATIKGLTANEFFDSLPMLCSEMHNELNVLTFGVILYDESTPEHRKLLRDSDYWEGLDAASGDRMVIFCLPDKITTVTEEAANTSTTRTLLTKILQAISLQGIIFEIPSMSIAGPQRLNLSYSSLLKSLFQYDTPISYPSVLFFQVVEGKIYDYCLVPLEENDPAQSFKATRDLFARVSSVLNDVKQEHFGNQTEIFNLLKDDLSTLAYTTLFLKGASRIKHFVELLRAFYA